MDRGVKYWVTILSQCIDPMLLQDIKCNNSIIIIMKRKEKATSGGAPETHLRKQVVLSRIFKRIVPVDYSSQSNKEYQEHFLLLVQ